MRVLIDADGCPVVYEAAGICREFNLECVIFCDMAHRIEIDGTTVVTVSTGADSVDFALVNAAKKGDVVITQDYGLAAMCLSREAFVLDQNGMEYTEHNIDSLLYSRHLAKKIRNAGGRLKGPSKRTKEQDKAFAQGFSSLLQRLRVVL